MPIDLEALARLIDSETYPAKPGTPPLSGGVGYLSGEVPDTDFADGGGQKPPLEGDLPGLSGRFSGGVVRVTREVVPVLLVEGADEERLKELLHFLTAQPLLAGLYPHPAWVVDFGAEVGP